MNLQKRFLINFTILIIVLLILTPGFSQVRSGETVSFSGMIKSISKDFKSILINNINIGISSDTNIFDEDGNSLKIDELRPQLYLTIEALENRSGFFAKKIVVRKPKGV